jgi:hypothetical protein
MIDVLLVQLPLPQLNFGHQTANIAFGAACLKQAAEHLKVARVEILPQTAASYWGDAALLAYIGQLRPRIIGFTVYLWNVRRTLWLARRIKNLYAARIIVGGPEVTPDNPLVADESIDFCVFGEGEALFTQLLQDPDAWSPGNGRQPLENHFATAPSPYFTVPLAPELEGTMLLETMRGCPHRCAYCYYNKSHERLVFKEDRLVLDGVAWALARNVKEVYFLDPSLSSRPGLKLLLKEMARLNNDHRLSFISELRADSVDAELAGLLAAAGFKWLEVGLQSTNPTALKAMHRSTDLMTFVQGVHHLTQRGINTAVDLIVGLPGDDPAGFDRTTRFVVDHGLHHDIQVFPLSLIPGTEFRRRHQELGLIYDPEPPYTVLSTPEFTSRQMFEAFDLAEERFDVALYPLPDLDLTYQTPRPGDPEAAQETSIPFNGRSLIYKAVLRKGRGDGQYASLAQQVTHPYQLLVPPATPLPEVVRALSIFTAANPHTPLELVFFDPRPRPDVQRLLNAAQLARPNYLDKDLRLLYPEPGNRAILFTVVSEHPREGFASPMQRHIFWWRRTLLPDQARIAQLEAHGFDGILIDPQAPQPLLNQWQDEMAPLADDLILIAFAWPGLHKRWLQKTRAEGYCLAVLPG